MQRFEHAPGWKVPEGKSYYRYWGYCKACPHLQHYPDAYVPTDDQRRMIEIRKQLGDENG